MPVCFAPYAGETALAVTERHVDVKQVKKKIFAYQQASAKLPLMC